MGANAQTAVPTFTASQVLTAAQMNQSARTGVPVFSSTVTRDAGFGGSGEKTLAEGQLCYVEGVGLQSYNGTAWVTWGAAPGLAYLTGATFTTVTSVSLPNDTFTSTYENYKIFFCLTALTADSTFTVRMRASGSDNTTSSYGAAFSGGTTSSATIYSVTNGGTSWPFFEGNAEATAADSNYNFAMDVISPKSANRTRIHPTIGGVNTTAAYVYGIQGQGFFYGSTSFDSLSVISSTASSMSGFYRVYGYSNS